MKTKIFSLFKLLFIAIVVFYGCKKDIDDESNQETYPNPPALTPIVLEGDSISVFSRLTIAFNYKLGQPKYYEGYHFIPVLDTIMVVQDGSSVEGLIMKLTDIPNYTDSDNVCFVPILPFMPGSTIEVKIVTHWEIRENRKITKFESNNTIFTCRAKKLPLYLDSLDIQVCYPLVNQYHFLKNEYPKGLIKLKRNRRDLFIPPVFSENDELLVKIKGKEGEFVVPAIYHEKSLLVEYDMPKNLINEQIYKFELFKKNKTTGKSVTYYTYYFRTSQYNTFEEKFNGLFPNKMLIPYLVQVYVNVFDLWSPLELSTNEVIDSFESVNGLLLEFEFDTADNLWYKENYSKLYNLIKSGTYSLINPTEPYAMAPTKYFKFLTNRDLNLSKLSEDQIKTGEAERISYKYCYLDYLGNRIFDTYMFDIQTAIIKKKNFENMTDEERYILSLTPACYYKGIYRYLVRYKIPVVDIVTFNDTLFVNQHF